LKLSKNQYGSALMVVLILMGVAILGVVSYISYSAWQENKDASNNQASTTVTNANDKKAFNCDSFWVNYPSSWHAWSESLDTTAQCTISNLTKDDLPGISRAVNKSDVAVTINFTRNINQSLNEYINEQYNPDGDDSFGVSIKSKSSFILDNGDEGIKVESVSHNGPGTSYYYKYESTVVNMYVDPYETQLLEEAFEVVKSVEFKVIHR
jgi:hypothetical protein